MIIKVGLGILFLAISSILHASVYQAKIIPSKEMIIYAPFKGRIESLYVQTGQMVEHNAPLLTLSTDDAEAKLVELKQKVIKLEQKLKSFDLNYQNLEWVKLSNQDKKTRNELQRAEKRRLDSEQLYKKGIISQEENDRDLKYHQEMKLAFDEVQILVKQFKSERSDVLKKLLKSEYDLAKKQEKKLETALSSATLYAPFKGRVKKLDKPSEMYREGAIIDANAAILSIEQDENPFMVFSLSEHELKEVEVGQEIQLEVSENTKLKAEIFSIEPMDKQEAHRPMSFQVKVKLKEDNILPPHLRMGMSVKAKVDE